MVSGDDKILADRRHVRSTVVAPADRSWFDLGGRHHIDNRISDFGRAIDSFDLHAYSAADIGCAEGDISAWLAGRFRHVLAMEFMCQAFKEAQQRLSGYGNIDVVQDDISRLPLVDKFDFIFMLGVLHYFESEAVHRRVITHCLEHTRYVFFCRSAVRDFRERDRRNLDNLSRYVALSLLNECAGSMWELYVVDNSVRGTGDKRLGDLMVFRRRVEDNPIPPLSGFFQLNGG